MFVMSKVVRSSKLIKYTFIIEACLPNFKNHIESKSENRIRKSRCQLPYPVFTFTFDIVFLK